MRNKALRPAALILFSISVFTAWIDPFNDKVSEGNRNYNAGKFNEALSSYKEAEKYAPDDKKRNMLEFNRGNAEFRINNHESALAKYRNSLNSGDPDVQKKALYNTGTTYMKMGKKKEAAENFIKALQIDPSYEKAKRNLEYLLKDKPQDKQQQNNDNSSEGNKQQQSSGSGRENNEQNKSDNQKGSAQVKNMLESMKNKPVRRQKGNGDGKKFLEKYW